MKISYLDKVLKLDRSESVFLKRKKMQELIKSIKKHGVLEPVEIDVEKGCFVDGQHRFVASKYLGIKEIPVLVKEIIKNK